MQTVKAIWAALAAWLAAIRGWRTMIVAMIGGAFAALIGAAQALDWAPVLRSYLPDVPAWAVGLAAAALGGALRAITTTPMGEKR